MRTVMPGMDDKYAEFKNFDAWYKRLTDRPAIKKTFQLRTEAIAQDSH